MNIYAIFTGDPDNTSTTWLEINHDASSLNEKHFNEGKDITNGEFTFNVFQGTQWTNGIGTTGNSDIVNQQILELLQSKDITGLDSLPIKIIDGDGIRNDYYIIRASSECGPIDKSQTKRVPSKINPSFMKRMGFGLDTTTIKSDIFRPSGTTMLLCNEKVKSIIEEHEPKISGIKFLSIKEFPM